MKDLIEEMLGFYEGFESELIDKEGIRSARELAAMSFEVLQAQVLEELKEIVSRVCNKQGDTHND
jgi:hypothetical protein